MRRLIDDALDLDSEPRTDVHYLIICRDITDSAERRQAHLPAHQRYVDDNADLIVLSGPLTDEHGQVRLGQLFVLDVPSAAEANAFVAADPFTRAGVFSAVDIDRLLVRIEHGSRSSATRAGGLESS